MAKHKNELKKKLAAQTPRAGTQNAAVQDDYQDTKSVASTILKADGMPSREELLKSLGYQETNIDLGDAESDA